MMRGFEVVYVDLKPNKNSSICYPYISNAKVENQSKPINFAP
jgi:hypothetical protein